MWSMLPGARTLAPTLITSKRYIKRRGFINIHTFQGECRRHCRSQILSAAAVTMLCLICHGGQHRQQQIGCWVGQRLFAQQGGCRPSGGIPDVAADAQTQPCAESQEAHWCLVCGRQRCGGRFLGLKLCTSATQRASAT